MENTTDTAQQNQPLNTEPQTLKEIAIEKKKDAFYKKLKITSLSIIAALFILILILFARMIYHRTKDTYVVNPGPESTSPESEIIITEEIPEEVDVWEIYSSEKYRFSFDYPQGDSLTISNISEDEFLVEVNSTDIIPDKNPDGQNLVKGYIFRVVPLKLAASNLESAANVKRDWYFTQCPKTANISPVVDRKIAYLDAKGFDITDCNSDFFLNYIAANGFVYEISQIYKGDLGFRQIYKSRTSQILSSLVVDVDLPELDPNLYYEDESIGFSFEYPREMNTECCYVPAPPQDELKNIITLSESDNTDTIGFFYSYKNYQVNLDEYVENQRMKLSDEYAIVKNRAPEGTKTEMSIAGQNALKLSDYSWRGNNLIYIPVPGKKNVLVISHMNVSDKALDTIFNSLTIR